MNKKKMFLPSDIYFLIFSFLQNFEDFKNLILVEKNSFQIIRMKYNNYYISSLFNYSFSNGLKKNNILTNLTFNFNKELNILRYVPRDIEILNIKNAEYFNFDYIKNNQHLKKLTLQLNSVINVFNVVNSLVGLKELNLSIHNDYNKMELNCDLNKININNKELECLTLQNKNYIKLNCLKIKSKDLKELNLKKFCINDKNFLFNFSNKFSKIVSLSLENIYIPNEIFEMRYLVNLKNLTTLSISKIQISNKNEDDFKKVFERLKVFICKSMYINKNYFKYLKNVEYLHISYRKFSNLNGDISKHWKKIKILKLYDVNVEKSFFEYIKNVEEMDLFKIGLQDMSIFLKMDKLKKLRVDELFAYKISPMIHFYAPNLTDFDTEFCRIETKLFFKFKKLIM